VIDSKLSYPKTKSTDIILTSAGRRQSLNINIFRLRFENDKK